MTVRKKKNSAPKIKKTEQTAKVPAVKKTVDVPKESKKAILIKLLKRPEGALIEELITATGWQQHSIRGTISRSVKKQLGLQVTYAPERRGKIYRIAGSASRS